MSLTFHWFLPTSGDGRSIVGRGHSVPLGPRGTGDLPAPNAAAEAAATAIRAAGPVPATRPRLTAKPDRTPPGPQLTCVSWSGSPY